MKLTVRIALLVSLLASLSSGCATMPPPFGAGRETPVDSVAFIYSSAAYIERGLVKWDSDDARAAVLDSLVHLVVLDYGAQYAATFSNAEGDLQADPKAVRRMRLGVLRTMDEFRGPYVLRPPRAPRPVSGVAPEDFALLQGITGFRYHLVVLGLGTKMTTANRVLSALSHDPAETVTIEAAIVDARTREVSRRVAVRTRLDPEVPEHVHAVVESALREVLTGRRVDPSSILRRAGR